MTSRTQGIYNGMIYRCHVPGNQSAKHYYDKGIRVCARWLESFDNFLADMGECPHQGLSLDRIDPNGNYEPGNCRWAPVFVQTWNRTRKNKIRHVFYETDRKAFNLRMTINKRLFDFGDFYNQGDAIRVRDEIEAVIDHLIDSGVIR
jgi:hypothetical protein